MHDPAFYPGVPCFEANEAARERRHTRRRCVWGRVFQVISAAMGIFALALAAYIVWVTARDLRSAGMPPEIALDAGNLWLYSPEGYEALCAALNVLIMGFGSAFASLLLRANLRAGLMLIGHFCGLIAAILTLAVIFD